MASKGTNTDKLNFKNRYNYIYVSGHKSLSLVSYIVYFRVIGINLREDRLLNGLKNGNAVCLKYLYSVGFNLIEAGKFLIPVIH
jgi:hypothetical protein